MRLRWRVVLLVLAIAVGILAVPARAHLRAAALLLRFADASGKPPTGLADFGRYEVDEAPFVTGDAPAILYRPRGKADAPGVVLVHGVHHDGIAEKRLVRFARTLAGSGLAVLTPEIPELRDYHVDPHSIDRIGTAVHAFASTAPGGEKKVGLMGLSFAGGLSLLAAANGAAKDAIGFVVAIGAHDDLARVSRFFAGEKIKDPDGHDAIIHAHDYGPLVLVYSHIEDFFAPEDTPGARECLKAWLWEDRDRAKKLLADLSPVAQEKLQTLFDGQIAKVAPEILADLERHADLMGPVSPHDHLGAIAAPVYLLHGAGDTVIPATETLWLARDTPASLVRLVLVSPALVHVELEGEPSAGETWALVHFMAEVLLEADR
jgi:pimeloyl-ACP methyl ester carboxylesterase